MRTINLPHNFTLRSYQVEPWNALLHPDFKRGVMVVPRRNGKDILTWNAVICKAAQVPALYYYMAPYYNQVRQIIWEGFDKDGRRFLDYIPYELVRNKTKVDMRIDLVNGSQIKLQGSDQIDRIVGTNPRGIGFTEFSLHKPGAWEYLRPILAENGGWAIFNGTPRGLNHFFDLYQQANESPNWYVQYLTRDDTGIPSLEAIDEDRRSGMPEELIQQEYYCSFLAGVVGSYYAKFMNSIRDHGQITRVPHDPRLPVYTFWDLGVDDCTSIWFAQFFRQEIRLIDYYENQGEGLTHYIKECKNREYIYSEHFAPWDIEIREFSTGVSRKQTASELGFDFTVIPKMSISEGIDAVREILPMCWFDANLCERGVSALMHYQKQWNERTQAYSNTPLHNWASHGADAFRGLAVMYDLLKYSLGRGDRAPRVLTSFNSIPSARKMDNFQVLRNFQEQPQEKRV